jgi:hypothetical protein
MPYVCRFIKIIKITVVGFLNMGTNFYNKDNNMELILKQDVQNLGLKMM